MKRPVVGALLVTLLLWPSAAFPVGPVCAATPDGAVMQALGAAAGSGSAQSGFRVRNIVVDPLLHRAFVHVEQCDHPERPLVLLAFAGLGEAKTTSPDSGAARTGVPGATVPQVPAGSKVIVNMGGTHVRLSVGGRLLRAAAVGSIVEVQLASLGDAAAQSEHAGQVRGTLVAADRVEVQP